MNLLKPLLIATAASFVIFFSLGVLVTIVLSAQDPAEMHQSEGWQLSVLSKPADPSALYQQLMAHRLMSKLRLKKNTLENETNLSASHIQIPGVGRLLGLLLQGQEQLALIQALDGKQINAFRAGDSLTPDTRLVAVKHNAIELQQEGKPITTINLYPTKKPDD